MAARSKQDRAAITINARAARSCKVEVVAVERPYLHILQRDRVAPRRNDDVVASLRCVGKNAGKAVELGLAELDGVVTRSAGNEILDDVIAEIRGKDERIRMALADKNVIPCRACQRAVARRRT